MVGAGCGGGIGRRFRYEWELGSGGGGILCAAACARTCGTRSHSDGVFFLSTVRTAFLAAHGGRWDALGIEWTNWSDSPCLPLTGAGARDTMLASDTCSWCLKRELSKGAEAVKHRFVGVDARHARTFELTYAPGITIGFLFSFFFLNTPRTHAQKHCVVLWAVL